MAAEARRIEAKRRETEVSLAEAEAVHEQVKEKADQLEACFSTFGHRLPALEKAVQESLHNPRSFEHVETLAIVPEADGSTVAMKFRAENGFGATRLGLVKAAIIPETCEIVSIGESETL